MHIFSFFRTLITVIVLLGGGWLNTVEPIRDLDVVMDIAEYLKGKSDRDYVMFMFGIYTGLRISDILKFRVRDVRDKDAVYIREKKTGKEKRFPTIKNKDTLRDKVRKAQENPLLVKNLVCKEFNIRETSSESWLNFEDIDNNALFDIAELKPRYGIGGNDLSSTNDLTNATMLFMVPGDDNIYVEQMYWIPEDLVEQRVKEDKIPYDLWIEQGWMRTCPGNKIHYKYVVEWFKEMQLEKDIYLFKDGYDAWSATYFVEEMNDTFGRSVMEPVAQGKKTLSSPMKSLGADLKAKRIIYNNNPVLKWCICNTSVDIDKNNNIQPCKGTSPTRRIDGLAGLLDAYVMLENHLEEYLSLI